MERFHELDTYIRENYPIYRVYDWRSVESMRESLAEYGLGYNSEKIRANQSEKVLEQIKGELSQLISVMRDAKDYHYSDKIREIISKAGHGTQTKE